MNNPQAMLQKMGMPQGMQNNPQAMIQYLMDTGKLTQAQYSQLQAQAKQFQSMLK
jgi:hypothetical protein